jgi:hypothetical protein
MMAINRWIGGATAVKQVDTFTPDNVEIGDIFLLAVTGEDGSTTTISFTATEATVANVVAGLVAAWNASTNALCTPITATNATTGLTLTADMAGVPFYVSASTSNGGGNDTQILSREATTANAGPNDIGTAANWSMNVIPAAGDDVYIDSGSDEIIYGLNQASILLASFNVSKSFTGKIGQAGIPLRISTAMASLGYFYGSGSASGSGRINVDFGSTETEIEVRGTASSSADTSLQPTRIKANNANTAINILAGTVGIGTNHAGESAVIGPINVGDARVTIGGGVEMGTYSQTDGTNILQAGCTMCNVFGGSLTKVGNGNIATLNTNGGKTDVQGSGSIGTCNAVDGNCYLSSSGTVDYLNVSGVVDMMQSPIKRAVNHCTVYSGATLKADKDIVTFTNGVQLVGCTIQQCDLDFGYGVKLGIS